MKPKVCIARPVPERVKQFIGQHCDYRVWHGSHNSESFFEAIADVDGLLTNNVQIDAHFFDRAPRVRIVSNMSVGYNNFDLQEMRRRGVIGTHTPGVLDDTVADLIVGLMLSAARRIPELDRLVRGGRWSKDQAEANFGLDVHHRTVGIIGMGRIGNAVAARAKFGFNMDVVYCNRSRNAEAEQQFGARYMEMDELLSVSDFVVVMTPLTKDTYKLLGEREFALMKRTAIFVNASRGPVVDEQALLRALQTKTIYAAGLDVYEEEPVAADHPLLKLDNVVLLPHIGSATSATRADMAMLAAQNLVMGVTGQRPPHIVRELADMAALDR